jgi:aryl-alcohol dehydrogenase-like predicted oxidoreductase
LAATWVTFGPQVADETAESIVTLAYEAGINVFDTSEVYSCGRAETLLGKILQKKAWNRASFNVITKVHWGK